MYGKVIPILFPIKFKWNCNGFRVCGSFVLCLVVMALLLQYVIYILAEFVGIEREKYTENWMKRNFANNPRDRADVWKNEAKHILEWNVRAFETHS